MAIKICCGYHQRVVVSSNSFHAGLLFIHLEICGNENFSRLENLTMKDTIQHMGHIHHFSLLVPLIKLSEKEYAFSKSNNKNIAYKI